MQTKQLIGSLLISALAVGVQAQSTGSGTPDSAAGAGSSTMSTSPSQSPQAADTAPSSGTWSSSTGSATTGDRYDTMTSYERADSIHSEPRGSQLPGSLGEGEATRTPELVNR